MAHQSTESSPRKPLRLWPGVTAAVLLAIIRFIIPAVAPDVELFGMEAALLGVLGGVVLSLVVILWWLFFSRAPWAERLGAIALMIVAVVATRPFVHESIQNGHDGDDVTRLRRPGNPEPCLRGVGGRQPSPVRRSRAGPRMVVAILVGCGMWATRSDQRHPGWRRGCCMAVDADRGGAAPRAGRGRASRAGGRLRQWRHPTEAADQRSPKPRRLPAVSRPSRASAKRESRARASGFTRVEWPGFRGPNRDGIVRGVRINTDWTASPPVQLWRRPIGPGWSSFAVAGGRLYTQEQRGDDEIVACYDATTGKPVWMHRDPVRFWESNGGAGPRATPTLSNGRVYTLGATGILNALDARTGAVVWSRNVATDSGVKVPVWGFTASPLVVGDLVVRRRFRRAGRLRRRDRNAALVAQVRRWKLQLAALRDDRRRSAGPAVERRRRQQRRAGRRHAALGERVGGRPRSCSRRRSPPATFLITTADAMGGLGMRRLAVTRHGSGWTVEERWTSRGLKPYFNDYVVHQGHAYGFDGSILSCIDLRTARASGRADDTATASSSCWPTRTCCWCSLRKVSWRW